MSQTNDRGDSMQTSTDKSSATAKPSRRLAAAVATVVAAAALAGTGLAAAHATQAQTSAAGCPEWMCGDNHNEVMATTAEGTQHADRH